jgi:hypothetical protein
VEAALLETTMVWEPAGGARGAGRAVLGAVDDPCWERLLRGCRDLATGALLLDESADDRTYTTWQAWAEERLQGRGTGGRYGLRDRAQALLQLAEHGLECLRMPDCFHGVHALVQISALAMGQRWRHAPQELPTAQETLPRLQGPRQAAHHPSRGHFERLSHTLPPCRLSDATPQTAAQVARQRTAAVEGSAAGAVAGPSQGHGPSPHTGAGSGRAA